MKQCLTTQDCCIDPQLYNFASDTRLLHWDVYMSIDNITVHVHIQGMLVCMSGDRSSKRVTSYMLDMTDSDHHTHTAITRRHAHTTNLEQHTV